MNDHGYDLHLGDCLEVMRGMSEFPTRVAEAQSLAKKQQE